MLDTAGKDGLSKAEQLAIERSQASSRGIASFVVALAEPILTSATAVAALSCEALEAQVLLVLDCLDCQALLGLLICRSWAVLSPIIW